MIASPHDIPGYLDVDEGEWLALQAHGGTAIEIGCFRGRSTAFLATSARRVYVCDHFRGQPVKPPEADQVNFMQVQQDFQLQSMQEDTN